MPELDKPEHILLALLICDLLKEQAVKLREQKVLIFKLLLGPSAVGCSRKWRGKTGKLRVHSSKET